MKQSEITIGDSVLCQQQKQNKLTTRFNPVPFTVIKINGTRVTARNGNKFVTRNVSNFKRISRNVIENESDYDLRLASSSPTNKQQTADVPKTEKYLDPIDSSIIR